MLNFGIIKLIQNGFVVKLCFFFLFLKDEEFSFSSPENFEFFGFSLTWRHCEYFFWKILTANEIFLLKNWIPFISLCLPVG